MWFKRSIYPSNPKPEQSTNFLTEIRLFVFFVKRWLSGLKHLPGLKNIVPIVCLGQFFTACCLQSPDNVCLPCNSTVSIQWTYLLCRAAEHILSVSKGDKEMSVDKQQQGVCSCRSHLHSLHNSTLTASSSEMLAQDAALTQ